jgi:hypothetical protein
MQQVYIAAGSTLFVFGYTDEYYIMLCMQQIHKQVSFGLLKVINEYQVIDIENSNNINYHLTCISHGFHHVVASYSKQNFPWQSLFIWQIMGLPFKQSPHPYDDGDKKEHSLLYLFYG